MALDKAIASGKEHRKRYRRSKAFDATCRCNGSCGYCRENRLYQVTKEFKRTDEQLREYNEKH